MRIARDGAGAVVGPGRDGAEIFGQSTAVEGGGQYGLTAIAQSADGGSGIASLQVNWHAGDGAFLGAFARNFHVDGALETVSAVAVAPEAAATANVYVVPGEASESAVRYTAMALERLDPVQDFFRYLFFAGVDGLTITLWALAPLGLVAAAYYVRRAYGGTIVRMTSTAAGVFYGAAGPHPASGASRSWLIGLTGLYVAVLGLLLMLKVEGHYESNYDTHLHQGWADYVFKWTGFSLDFSGNLLGNFGLQPFFKPGLWPGYWIAQVAPTEIQIPVHAAVLLLTTVLILSFVLLRCGVGAFPALSIGFLAACMSFVPDFTGHALTHNAVLGLVWQETSLLMLVIVCLFAFLGASGGRANILLCLGLIAAAFWSVLSVPYTFAFLAFSAGFAGIVLFVTSKSRRELTWKASAAAVVAVLMLAAGVHDFFLNAFSYTPQMYFSSVKEHSIPFFGMNGSILMRAVIYAHYQVPYVAAYYGLMVVGAAAAWRYAPKGPGRRFATTVVALVALVHGVGYANELLGGLPVAFMYIEQTANLATSGLAAFGAYALAAGALRAIARFGVKGAGALANEPRRRAVTAASALFLIPLVYYAAADTPIVAHPWPPEARSTPAQIQVEALALEPGGPFRGRSIALLGRDTPDLPAAWGAVGGRFIQYMHHYGSDFRLDAAALDVPIANEYGHWLSPPTLALMAAGFYKPIDMISRTVQLPRAFRENLARLMGVRLIVTDAPMDQELIYQSDSPPLYLYGVSDSNLGDFSPTRIVTADTAADILDVLTAPGFDGRRTAVAEKTVGAPLVPAQAVEVTVHKGPELRITGRSDSVSVLAAPFEFSHCLQITGEGLREALPVNLAQIGLVVSGRFDIRIRYRYGLLAGVDCRAQDLDRIERLGLDAAARGRLFQ